MSIVRVALDVPLPTLFDYTVDEGIVVVPGQRVVVPFGRRQLVGVVMERVATTGISPQQIKPVAQVLRDSAPLSPQLLELLNFCSDYYHYPIGQTALSALPAQLRSDKPTAAHSCQACRTAVQSCANQVAVGDCRRAA